MLFYQFHGFGLVLVFVFLVAFFLVHVSFDVFSCLVETWNGKLLIDFLCQIEGIGFVVFEFYFYQVSFWDKVFVGFILVVQLGVNRQNVFLQFFVADILKFQWLDCIGKETACRLEYGVRITYQVDELGVREHLDQLFHTSGVRRVLAQELSSLCIPE